MLLLFLLHHHLLLVNLLLLLLRVHEWVRDKRLLLLLRCLLLLLKVKRLLATYSLRASEIAKRHRVHLWLLLLLRHYYRI